MKHPLLLLALLLPVTVFGQSVETVEFRLSPTMLAGDGSVKSCGLRMIGTGIPPRATGDSEIQIIDASLAIGVELTGMGKAGYLTSTMNEMKAGKKAKNSHSKVKWIKVGESPANTPRSGPFASTDDGGYWYYGADPGVVIESLLLLAEGARVRVAFELPKPNQYVVFAGPASIDEASRAEFDSCMSELSENMKRIASRSPAR